jgi:predicted transposase/invertase (TIGR01784 family)
MEVEESVVEIDRQVDVVFKAIFGNADILARFLTTLLGVEITPEELVYIQTEIGPEYIEDKAINMDIQVANSKTHDRMNIEMQIRNQGNIKKRTLFYLSKSFVSQLKEGEKYDVLTRQIVILIANFEFIDYNDKAKAYGVFQFRERDTGELFSDLLEFHVFELKKIKKLDRGEKITNPIMWWMDFINNEKGDYMQQIAQLDPMIQKAMNVEKVFFNDDKQRRLYELRVRAIRDYDSGMSTAKAEGITEGRVEGRVEGRAEGRAEGRVEIAKNMLTMNMSYEVISQATGLSIEDIKNIRQ